MVLGPIQSATQAVNNYKSAHQGLYNVPAKNIVLPGLLLGNMAYKLGTEKNPEKRNEVLWNSAISWLGGTLLYNANSKVLPYFTLPGVAGAIALFKIAQKDTPEEKTDTAINHASWWLSGMGVQKIANLMSLKGPFHTLCAFAVGSSVVGPIIASLVKQHILPKFGKNNAQVLGSSFDTLRTGYNTGNRTDTTFSPFTEPAPYQVNALNQKTNVNLNKPPANYDPFDPFNLKNVIPGGFLK